MGLSGIYELGHELASAGNYSVTWAVGHTVFMAVMESGSPPDPPHTL